MKAIKTWVLIFLFLILTIYDAMYSAAGAETEPNDTRATANPVTLGSAITSQLSSMVDIDYYSVTVGSSKKINLSPLCPL